MYSDLADAFPHGQFSAYYRAEWLTLMIKETRQNRDFQSRTIDTARWAREQVKRQIGGTQGVQQT
jgi:importin subunit beta-1